MAIITPREGKDTISVSTTKKIDNTPSAWWKEGSALQRAKKAYATAVFLKQQQQYRYRQAATYAKLYSNIPLYGFAGSSFSKISQSGLPLDRPTLNVVQSCVDTLVSKISQSRPRPTFITDNGDYKQRKIAKEGNSFINGEFYKTKAYKEGTLILRDAAVLGKGVLKVFRGQDDKVKVERRLKTEIIDDRNDALWAHPRQRYELQLIDRGVLMDMFPNKKALLSRAENSYPDQQEDAQQTVSDQVLVVEAWHLKSGPDANDGCHVIALCDDSLMDDPKWDKDRFPHVELCYSDTILGNDGQGLAEQLMGTQMEINKLLMVIQKSIQLVGVPKVFVEEGSKVVSSHLNNDIGTIVKYRGIAPTYETPPCVAPEIYAQLERLVNYAYQQSGVSALSAAAQKPAGLNSGEAIRNYDDLQTDRFASLSKRYDDFYVELAYLIFDVAQDIKKDIGKYDTMSPLKQGVRQVELPDIDLTHDPFVIQAYDASSLPRDPAGRLQKITEMIQSGMIDIKEGRRLLDFPDLDQVEKLANASEERIYQALDKIIEEGDYTPPDAYMNPQLANTIAIQYYNLYVAAKLEEDKAEQLRTFIIQTQDFITQATPAPMPTPGAPGQATAAPMPVPQSPLVPNGTVQ